MNIFLSHSSAQRDIAHRLALSLEGQGHAVFFDETDLDDGQEFEGRIRHALDEADLFIFLISPESVAPGSYPLAELDMAEKRWPQPDRRVLPIVVRDVPIDSVPPYARAVSILKPRGDLVAEASAAVARMAGGRRPGWLKLLLPVASILVLIVLLLGYTRIQADRARQQEVDRILAAATLDMDAGQYDAAFKALAGARSSYPGDDQLRRAQEKDAMLWARNIRVVAGQQTFTGIVNTIRPVLSAGVPLSEGVDAADLLAHLGWCEYLLDRESTGGDPVTYFKRALELDPGNPYAHAMWGFWSFYKGGSIEESIMRFREAAQTGRELEWVRNIQISTMLLRSTPESEGEAVRAANTMRMEKLQPQNTNRLWNVYYAYLLRGGSEAETFLDILPGDSHLQTFQWLFPEEDVDEYRLTLYRFMRGRLEEAAGDREKASANYRWVEEKVKNSPGSLQDRTAEGLKRLTSSR